MRFLSIFLLLFTINLYSQTEKDTLSNPEAFELGEVILYGNTTKNKINQQELTQFNKKDVAEALNILPSVILNNVGSRNESSVYVRGFDIRSVPIYIDGVPVYMPFDGYADLSRFTTADLSKIEVSKGYSSILYGPNALGGTINLISTRPQGAFDLKAKAGLLTGNGFNNYVSVGTNQDAFYLQTVYTQFDRDYLNLSHNFEITGTETDLERNNSYRKDRKFTAKAGFTPNATDEYSISYINQKGEKGQPVYLGNDATVKLRYWQWPYWDKESVYFISRTQLGNKTQIKSRVYKDNYENQLKSFDNDLYTTQTKKSSFTSFYKDETYGGNLEVNIDFEKHRLSSAFHYKRDKHQANNLGDLPEHLSDDTYSIGIEDVYLLKNQAKLIVGSSYNIRKSLEAEDTKIINPDGSFESFPKNDNQALNGQTAIYFPITKNLEINSTLSYKTRFATMKDRYSYKMGTAIPNPDLKSEGALNAELGVTYKKGKLQLIPELFFSALHNTIQSVNNVEPGISQMQNTGKSQFYGADLSIGYQILKNLDAALHYTFIQRKNRSNPELLFTDVPENHLFAYVKYHPVKNLSLNLNGEFADKRYSTSYGVSSPAYYVLHTHLGYDFKNGLQMESGVNNILDRNYTLTEGYPEQGRNYYFSLLYQFHLEKGK